MQRKIENYLFLFIVQFLFIGCNNESQREKNKIVLDSAKINTIVKDTSGKSVSVNHNVVKENEVAPYKQVDSIAQLLDEKYDDSLIIKLDSICNYSDGDLTEDFDGISIKLFKNNLNEFTEYLINNPNSCLKVRLIEAIGSDYFVYEKKDRCNQLISDRDKLINKAKGLGMSDQKIKFIKSIFDKVNPNILD